jgi:hypothetical protein
MLSCLTELVQTNGADAYCGKSQITRYLHYVRDIFPAMKPSSSSRIKGENLDKIHISFPLTYCVFFCSLDALNFPVTNTCQVDTNTPASRRRRGSSRVPRHVHSRQSPHFCQWPLTNSMQTKIADLVQITPKDFRKESTAAIEDNINAKYANKVRLDCMTHSIIFLADTEMAGNSEDRTLYLPLRSSLGFGRLDWPWRRPHQRQWSDLRSLL